MKIFLLGETGGIGSAIRESLKSETFVLGQSDWNIFAQGVLDENDIKRTFSSNTITCIELTEQLLPTTEKGFIYISSTAALKPTPDFPVYAASKAALNSYCQSMAKAHPMLSFYAVCPGPTDTKMWKSLGISGQPQPPSAVAETVRMCIGGAFQSGDIITVRDGIISNI